MTIPIREMLMSDENQTLNRLSTMTPEFVCIHNTENDASANNEIIYANRTKTPAWACFHYAVDDIEIVQGLPLSIHGWHAGDGRREGNMKSIGIEICYSKSGGARFEAAERHAAEFTAELLKKYGWGIDRVKKHQDFSGKYCPHRTLDIGWSRFLSMVRSYLGGSASILPPQDTPQPRKSIDEIAREVIDGRWGNGQERKNKLAASGYDYAEVQATANAILGSKPSTTNSTSAKKSNEAIAREVADGKWGNGQDRKNRLAAAGYDYTPIQALVNKLLKK